jgi:PilZ domain
MEFAAALNISAGGALLHTRSFFPVDSMVTLRVPLSPVLGREHRDQQIEARILRFDAREKGFDLAVEFTRTLVTTRLETETAAAR